MLILVLTITVFLSGAPIAEARILPRFGKATTRATSSFKGVSVSARLRADRKALLVTFGGLQNATGVTYTLTYQTDGKEEGISGSVDSSVNSVTRELLFGTCSAGVCRYHSNITNMKLEVVSNLTSGKKSIRRFRIKV
jgi:hypothetical protein